MTSLNNVQTAIEPVFTAVLAGLIGSLVLGFCQYFNERRRRHAFRSSWIPSLAPDRLAPGVTAVAPADSEEKRIIESLPTAAARFTDEPFPSFASYFIRHLGRYSFAILSVTLVLVVRWWLDPVLEGRMPFSFFLAAVLFTARTQGIWETLLALLLGFLLGTWFFAQPKSLGFSGQHDWWAAGLYLMVGLGIVWFLKSEQTAWLRTMASDISALKGARQPHPAPAQTQRELMANIVECAQAAIISVTPDGRIMSWNSAAEVQLGWPARETIGQPLANLLSPTRRTELRELLDQSDRGERRTNWHMILQAKNGEPIEVCMSVSPVRDASDRLVGTSLIAQDLPRGCDRRSTTADVVGGQ